MTERKLTEEEAAELQALRALALGERPATTFPNDAVDDGDYGRRAAGVPNSERAQMGLSLSKRKP